MCRGLPAPRAGAHSGFANVLSRRAGRVAAHRPAFARRGRRRIGRLALRGGAQARRAHRAHGPEGSPVRDRLRPLGPAAYRHVRRSRAHDHGAPRLRDADRRQDQDAAARLLRRHGRAAQGARQRAQQGDADAASRQAADADPRSVRQVRELRAPQQRDAARLPRPLRLRLRVRVLDRLLHVRPLRRGAAAHARALRRGAEDHAALAARGARRRPIRRSCRSIRRPAS